MPTADCKAIVAGIEPIVRMVYFRVTTYQLIDDTRLPGIENFDLVM